MFEALKIALDAFKKLESAHLKSEQLDAVIAARNAVLDILGRMDTVREEREQLRIERDQARAELAAIESWDEETAGYQLSKTDFGSFVYSTDQAKDRDSVEHHLCAKCFGERKKSVLQPTGKSRQLNSSGNWYAEHECQACHSVIAFGHVVKRARQASTPPTTRTWR